MLTLTPSRGFWLAVSTLLAAMAILQVSSVRQESQTWDEGTHLVSGYSYLVTGDYRLNREHPPLHKYLNALPLLAMNPELKTDTVDWQEGRAWELGQQFLYKNRVPADRMLLAARLMTILLSLVAGLVLALWTRSQFGNRAAILALCFFVFDPNVLAHGRYVTSDLCITLFSFAACIAWGAWLVKGGVWRLLVAGLVLGLALISKFSAAFLVPALLLLTLARLVQKGRGADRRGLAGSLAGAFLLVWVIGGLVVVAAYPEEASLLIPKTRRQLESGGQPPLSLFVSRSTAVGRGLVRLGDRLHLRAHSYLLGLGMVAEHNASGHPSYLMGHVSQQGHWNYFPVAFLVKTPLGTLAAIALVFFLGAWWAAWKRKFLFRREGEEAFAWVLLTIPPVVYLAFTIVGGINIGLRHLLPVYPFLCVWLGVGLTRIPGRFGKIAAAALVLATAGESLSVYPHYLAFFNRAVGGPANGARYLVDSNIDWGQDLKRLKRYLDEHHYGKVCLAYFGSAPPRYYGIDEQYLPAGNEWKERSEMICPVAAASVTLVMGVYVPPERLAWLRSRRPIDRVGYSLNIYRISDRDKRPETPAK